MKKIYATLTSFVSLTKMPFMLAFIFLSLAFAQVAYSQTETIYTVPAWDGFQSQYL